MRILIIVLVGLILFFSLLGLRGLCEPDEGRYAEIAREIIETKDWLTPHLNYLKYFHKPPLTYWLTASSFLCFGINEFSARLPVAVFGVLGLIVTYLLSLEVGKNRTTGFISAIILATTFEYFSWTQILNSDMIFSFFILLSFYGFWKKSILFYIAAALAFLTKGPVSIVIIGLVVGTYYLFSKDNTFFKKTSFFKGFAIFLAIVLPWFIYVCANNPGLFKYFLFYQSLDRLFTNVHGKAGSIFYFIPIFVLGGLPWIIFLPWALKNKNLYHGVRVPKKIYKYNLFLVLWIFIPFLFFSLSMSKLSGYILPVFPALAIIVGNYLSGKKRYITVIIVFFIFSIFYIIGTGSIPWFEDRLGGNLSVRKPSAIIEKYSSPNDKIVNYRCFLQGLPFYVGKRTILVQRQREVQFEKDNNSYKDYLIPNIEEFIKSLKDDETFWCFCRTNNDYNDFVNNYPMPLYHLWQSGGYALITNKPVNYNEN